MPLACVLISDITGSTQLYEREGSEAAVSHIGPVIERMRELIDREGGHCVKSKGDDTISFFPSADAAFDAAWAMVSEDWHQGMSVHAGIYFGEVLHQEAGLYGSAVNTAARLASLAKPGEVLVGDNCQQVMTAGNRNKLQPIGELHLKGMEAPTRVFSASVPGLAATTVVFANRQQERPSRSEAVTVSYEGQTWQIANGESLTLGRSEDCDIVLNHAWVSRRHGELTIRQWQIEYADHSSTGSVVRTADGKELSVHRRATMLNGSGTLILGPSGAQGDQSAVHFEAQDLQIKAG